jgi:hypothetical protein
MLEGEMMMPDPTMRAAVLTGPGRIEIREIPRPFPQTDESPDPH